ncbi:MAG: hypothetical protein IT435_11180 [Phycisphaerales bacterium]|nr:hypothetical protein [Phycisphaerales bacterium]
MFTLSVCLLLAGVGVGVGVGCTRTRLDALQDVAKGWCETIRASQVIPVYPLTEDLRPGDVFLVRTPISQEAERYRTRGFLALDDFRTRLALSKSKGGYENIYFDGYWVDPFGAGIPNARPSRTGSAFPGGDLKEDEADQVDEEESDERVDMGGEQPEDDADDSEDGGEESEEETRDSGPSGATLLSEAMAPRAAFPSYSFEVSASGGMSIALPIKGIPVAMGLLRADRATASVAIADARTYSGDPDDIAKKLKAWSEKLPVHDMLAKTAKDSRYPIFLRVVTRVYMTGAMNVSITRNEALATSASAGKAPQFSLINDDGSLNTKAEATLRHLNGESDRGGKDGTDEGGAGGGEGGGSGGGGSSGGGGDGHADETSSAGENGGASALAGLAPEAGGNKPKIPTIDWAQAGGAFKFTSLSSSTVTMAEAFDTLLVVGYLGLDFPVYDNGDIGPPIPTFQRLEEMSPDPTTRGAAESRLDQQIYALRGMTVNRPNTTDEFYASQLVLVNEIIAAVCRRVDPKHFKEVRAKAKGAIQAWNQTKNIQELANATGSNIEQFRSKSVKFTSETAESPEPYNDIRWSSVFDDEFQKHNQGKGG